MNVSLKDLGQNWQLLAIHFVLKSVAKFVGVWPVARRYANDHAGYLTLLMSTGLTFGTISSLYGLQAGYIDASQFSVLVGVIIATAVVPTFVAQRRSPLLYPNMSGRRSWPRKKKASEQR